MNCICVANELCVYLWQDFMLKYLITDAETVLRSTEYSN
jgi:hypothetical protein